MNLKKAMNRAIHWFFKLLELLVVVCMVAMVMVFGNVVLRYAFNSGISVADEMSRYFFIWLTYIGAMLAMHEGGHLGVDTLIKHLPVLGKKVCLFLSEALMLFCNVLFFMGTFKMHELQVTNVSPVVGMSMIWIYGIGYVVSVVMAVINLNVLFRLVTGRMDSLDLLKQSSKDCDALICASETLSYKWGFKDYLQTGVAGVAMLDLSWCGGLTEARKIAAMADARQLPVAPHDCTGPVVWAASSHLSLHAPNALIQESVRAFYTGWYKELVTELPSVTQGMLSLNGKPGLGLELLPDLHQRADATVRWSA